MRTYSFVNTITDSEHLEYLSIKVSDGALSARLCLV